MNYITFDIETYSPGNLNRIDTQEFRVSVVGCYISWIDTYLAFLENDVGDFINSLKKADLVVGFNHLWFDIPVLAKYSDFNLKTLPCYDILLEFEKKSGFKIKLNDLCKANFVNDVKTDSYEIFKNYHKENKWDLLIDYCLNDVRLTENLFRKVLNQEEILYYDLHQKKSLRLDQPVPGKVSVGETLESIF